MSSEHVGNELSHKTQLLDKVCCLGRYGKSQIVHEGDFSKHHGTYLWCEVLQASNTRMPLQRKLTMKALTLHVDRDSLQYSSNRRNENRV